MTKSSVLDKHTKFGNFVLLISVFFIKIDFKTRSFDVFVYIDYFFESWYT